MKMNNPTIQIAMVDDHAMFRSGIASLLTEYNDIEIVFQANNGVDMQNKIALSSNIQAILMDINMPHMDGYAATAWLNLHYPHIQVLALSMYDEEVAIIKMLKAGAHGYILKEAEIGELHKAILQIVEKGFYTNDIVTGNMIKNFHQKDISPSHSLQLSDKEILFLQLCASELTYKEMADQLDIAVRSVDNYSRNLFEKTGCKSRVGLVLWGLKNNIIKAKD
ncbi:MAG: response regulator transcription factor [Sediminibacterium sp.]|nr:response regulator transcription factor [Sediminibacterium sp.]